MLSYILRRLLQAGVVLLGVSVIIFIIIHLLPGGPARGVLGIHATPAAVRQFMTANGYNKPLWEQYLLYLDRLFHGNLGFSYQQNESVDALLAQDLPKTGILVGAGFVIALIVGVPLGLFQASRRHHPSDHALTAIMFTGYSMPVFWIGIVLIVVFAVKTHLLPPEAPQGQTVSAILSQPLALILPVATIAVVTAAAFSRFARSAAVENLEQDYVRTARSKGASDLRILLGHVTRNALLPIITLLGLTFPAVISGAIIVETVFNYPGMGLLFWNAALSHDYPVLLGVTLVVGAATVVGSLVADLLYLVADPRISY